MISQEKPDLEEPFSIFLLTKATKIPRSTTIDVSNFAPVFMLQMDIEFFNIEIICGFTSTFVVICSATSYPFGFTSIIKRLPLGILKFLLAKLRNQEKKVTCI